VVVWHVIAWVYGWVIQERYTANPPAYDWEDAGFTEGFFVLLLWGIIPHLDLVTPKLTKAVQISHDNLSRTGFTTSLLPKLITSRNFVS